MTAFLPSDADFLAVWVPGSRGAPQSRFARLLAATLPEAELAADTLGDRNRRIVALRRAWGGRRMDAVLICACGAENEAAVPEAAIVALPRAAGGTVRVGGARFRLPCMGDLADADGPATLARACCLEADCPALDDAALRALEAAWGEADPAAEIVLTTACVACGAMLSGTADVAAFAARDLDDRARVLYRTIDVIARAYGWREAEILALPEARRRVYRALIEGPKVAPGVVGRARR